MKEQKVQSLLMLPLTVRDQVLGLVELFDETGARDYTSEEIRLAQSLTSQAAIAIDHARMFAEEERRAAALAHTLDRQQELDRLRSEFIQNVSHELRTPLAIARGYAELLENGDLGELRPEQRKPIDIIARRMRMLGRMMDDIAAIIDTETPKLSREWIDLIELTRAAFADFEGRTQKANLTLSVQVPPELPPVLGDPIQLQRVLDNLLGNALKFTPPGGHIAIHVWQEEFDAVLQVSDTGIGIPESHIERIFERFYQVDGSPSRRYGGTGLGLALVKEIVQAHGGQVSARSQVGKGSTFRVTLPLG